MIFGEVTKTRYAPSSHVGRGRKEIRFRVVLFSSFLLAPPFGGRPFGSSGDPGASAAGSRGRRGGETKKRAGTIPLRPRAEGEKERKMWDHFVACITYIPNTRFAWGWLFSEAAARAGGSSIAGGGEREEDGKGEKLKRKTDLWFSFPCFLFLPLLLGPGLGKGKWRVLVLPCFLLSFFSSPSSVSSHAMHVRQPTCGEGGRRGKKQGWVRIPWTGTARQKPNQTH
jgi:hypothetical protein